VCCAVDDKHEHVPVMVGSPVGGGDGGRRRSLGLGQGSLRRSMLELQMDAEEERAVNEWDENVRRRTLSFVSMRPDLTASHSHDSGSSTPNDHRRLSPPLGGAGSRRGSYGPTMTFPLNHGHGSSDFPEVDVMNREDTLLNTTTGSGSTDDDDATGSRSSMYVDSPRTGRRLFRANFDVRGYDAKNVEVKLVGSRLVIHAIQAEQANGRKSTTEYCRKVRVPPDVDMDALRCFHANDMLTVEAPVRQPVPIDVTRVLMTSSSQGTVGGLLSPSSRSRSGSAGAATRREEPLNVAQLKMALDGHYDVTLLVEVGRVFRADDVTVKMAGPALLAITAVRSESNASSRMTASLSREFDLPSRIVPETLKAGFMANGLLRISARVLTEQHQNDVSNGNDDAHAAIVPSTQLTPPPSSQ
jgi:HSP20 family molecular chaperone IbpA